MDYNNSDIIIARATPIGNAALAVIRISGEDILDDISKFFSINKLKPRYVYVGTLKSPNNNQSLDKCVVTYFAAPKSYTGENMVEISCHGGTSLVEHIINEFVLFGYRVAYPGEFSYRAFKNNKIDLLQAESIAEKITSNTNKYSVLLQNMEDGSTSNKIKDLRLLIVNILSIIEHELDFNENEIEHLEHKKIIRQLKNISAEINQIVSLSEKIKLLDSGYKVMILGYPNVGKSTLFNKIIGQDKAITTSIKGTTRDILEAQIKIDNVPITLYDTAGYRKTKNKIELLGIKKSLALLNKMDVILIVDDHHPNLIKKELINKKYLSESHNIMLIKNKCDGIKKIQVHDKKNNIYQISAQQGLGVNQLLTSLLTFFNLNIDKNSCENIILCNARQILLLKQGNKIISLAIDNINQNLQMDIIASELKDFIYLMDEMLGKITSNEVLNNIFKGFCVGK